MVFIRLAEIGLLEDERHAERALPEVDRALLRRADQRDVVDALDLHFSHKDRLSPIVAYLLILRSESPMRIRSQIGLVTGVFFAALAVSDFEPGAIAAAPTACEALAQTRIANGTVTSAELVQAGAFTPPNATNNPNAAAPFATLPAFCRVAVKLTPTPDSDIRAEIWLPASGWNRKLQAAGNGGLGGAIPYPSMAAAIRAGYASAGTDTGHVGGNADFVAGHREKLVDFAHRAIHEMTVTAKTFITAHYDARPERSYFNSCSTGGRQALIEAQRYPEDFDGIVAGDASWDQMRLYAARVALNVYINRDPAAVMPVSKLPMIHKAVLDKCDAI